MMKVKPILFSGGMVRALLDGRKTQTRRIVKRIPCSCGEWIPEEMCATTSEGWQTAGHSGRWWCECCSNESVSIDCRYGKPGDALWVRETWASDNGRSFWYRADGETYNAGLPWKPSIHMPRLATRITLEIESVRVERLQEIQPYDAHQEGVRGPMETLDELQRSLRSTFKEKGVIENFRELWDSLNAKRGYGWEANPWVWALQFKVHKMNVDQFLMR